MNSPLRVVAIVLVLVFLGSCCSHRQPARRSVIISFDGEVGLPIKGPERPMEVIAATSPQLRIEIGEQGRGRWLPGEWETTATVARTADGATTVTVSDSKTKGTVLSLGSAGIGVIAGWMAGTLMGGLVP